MVGEVFVARCVERVRRDVPDAVAVCVVGSLLRGEAGPLSDVNFDAVVAAGRLEDGGAWYDQDGGRRLCISVWTRDAGQWLATQGSPAEWAFGLPCVEPGCCGRAVLRILSPCDDAGGGQARFGRNGCRHNRITVARQTEV